MKLCRPTSSNRDVAETIDVDVETLHQLNPSLLRLATPDDPSFELHLPRGTAGKFSAGIADIPPEKWVSWRRHKVVPGDTLTSVAKKYHVTAPAIASANNLEKGTELSPGDKLIIPAAKPAGEATNRLVRYRVRKGDTLGGIADRYSEHRRHSQMEPPESRPGKSRNGPADLHNRRCAGSGFLKS
jgi:LysM repeat protein